MKKAMTRILVTIPLVVVCALVPFQYAHAEFGTTDSTNLKDVSLYTRNLNTQITSWVNSVYGWSARISTVSANTPAYWLSNIKDKVVTVQYDLNNAYTQMFGWKNVINSPAANTPAYWLQGIYNSVVSIDGKINSSGGSSGGSSGIEDWATLMGWLSSINGNQQLMYGELQTISDRILDIGSTDSSPDSTEQIEEISTLLSTMAPQIRDITNQNDEATLKKLIDTIRSNVLVIKDDNDSIKSTLQSLLTEYQLYVSSGYGWNKSLQPVDGTPAYWVNSIYSDVKTLLSSVNSGVNALWGWNRTISNPAENTPAYWLYNLSNKVNSIYSSVLGGYNTSWGWNTNLVNPTSNSPADWLKSIYQKVKAWNPNSSGGDVTLELPEQPWSVTVENLPLYGTNPPMVRVHDEGVYDQLGNIYIALQDVLTALRTPDVPDLVGDFDYASFGEQSDDLVDRLATLAPFGAGALISAMLAIWSGSGAVSQVNFTVPFDFFGNGNVVIDLAWLEDGKPLIDFIMISLLIWCLANASLRIIELESAR